MVVDGNGSSSQNSIQVDSFNTSIKGITAQFHDSGEFGEQERNQHFIQQQTDVWKDWEGFFTDAGNKLPGVTSSELDVVEPTKRFVGCKTEYRLRKINAPSDNTEGDTTTKEKRSLIDDVAQGGYAVRSLQDSVLKSVRARRALQELVAEYKVLSCLAHHPNVCSIAGQNTISLTASSSMMATASFFYLTNYMASTLEQKIITWKSSHVDLAKRLVIALDIAAGLVHLHSHEIAMYVRPNKIGFDMRSGQVKLFDLGQARRHGIHYHPTALSTTEKSDILHYTAPECFSVGTKSTCDVDTYAFGILLWEIITLMVPYEGSCYDWASCYEMVVMGGKRPRITKDTVGEQNKDLAVLLQKAWHPTKRTTMAKAQKALVKFLKSLGVIKTTRRSMKGRSESDGSITLQRGLSSVFSGQNDQEVVDAAKHHNPSDQTSVLSDASPKSSGSKQRNRSRSRRRSARRLNIETKSSVSTATTETETSTTDSYPDDFMSKFILQALEKSKESEDLIVEPKGAPFEDTLFPEPTKKQCEEHNNGPPRRVQRRNRSMAHGEVFNGEKQERRSKRHSIVGSGSCSKRFDGHSSLGQDEFSQENDIADEELFQITFPDRPFGAFDNDSTPVRGIRRAKSSDAFTRSRRSSSNRLKGLTMESGKSKKPADDDDLVSLALEDVFGEKRKATTTRLEANPSTPRRSAPVKKSSLRLRSTVSGKPNTDIVMEALNKAPPAKSPGRRMSVANSSVSRGVRQSKSFDLAPKSSFDFDDCEPTPTRGLVRMSSDQSHARVRTPAELGASNRVRKKPDIENHGRPERTVERALSTDALFRLETSVNQVKQAQPKKKNGILSFVQPKGKPESQEGATAMKTIHHKNNKHHRRGSVVSNLLGGV